MAEYTTKTRPPKPSHFTCKKDKKIRLRLVNGGAGVPLRFWMSGHKMTIIAKVQLKQ